MNAIHQFRLFDIPSLMGTKMRFEYLRKGKVEVLNGIEAERLSDIAACSLMRLGIQPAASIISLIRDNPYWNIGELAVLKAGYIHVPLSPATTQDKLMQIISVTKPAMIIVESKMLERQIRFSFQQRNIKVPELCLIQTLLKKESCDYSELEKRKESVDPNDTAVILFTSGTTSNSKGVLLTHQNILLAAEEFGYSDAFEEVSRSLSILPMSHSAARKVNYSCQLRGITICYAAPSLNILENTLRFRVEHTALVPHFLQLLRTELEAQPEPKCPLAKINSGGAALPEDLWYWFEESGIKVYEVYGLTETASLLTYSSNNCRGPNCVGLKASRVETRITPHGELEVRGPTLCNKYLMSDGKIVRAVSVDGWFRTGDFVSEIGNGGLRVVGRVNRAYKNQRGNHVFPEEVENNLMSFREIKQARLINKPEEPLKAILLSLEEATGKDVLDCILIHNRKMPNDLSISSYAIINQQSWDSMYTKGVLKPDRRIFEEIIEHAEFQVLDWS